MNCPNCQAPNRPEAAFCARCGQTLRHTAASTGPMPSCPHCGQINRAGARYCRQCGADLIAPTPAPRPADTVPAATPSPALSPAIYWAATLAALLLVGITVMVGLLLLRMGQPVVVTTPTPPPSPTPAPALAAPTSPRLPTATPLPVGDIAPATPLPAPSVSAPTATLTADEALNRALHASVQVIVPVTGEGPASTGSGSVLTPQGHILTNFHVLGDVATGRIFNERGLIYIAVSPANLRQSPELKYQAQLVEADLGLDLALLKITALQHGENLPPNFELTPISIGNSDTVNIGDALTIIGFPGLGGETVTLTRGSVAGFLPAGDWLKTDAEINPGNSGGAAVDLAGRLVGIPTQITLEREDLPGKIGLIRPVNLARPLIDKAFSDTP